MENGEFPSFWTSLGVGVVILLLALYLASELVRSRRASELPVEEPAPDLEMQEVQDATSSESEADEASDHETEPQDDRSCVETAPEEDEGSSGRRSPFMTLEDLEGARRGLKAVESTPRSLSPPGPEESSASSSVRERAAQLNERIAQLPVPVAIPVPRTASASKDETEKPPTGSHYHNQDKKGHR